MITRTSLYDFDEHCLRLRVPAPLTCAFFDIETTGFKASTSQLYLIGAAYPLGGSWQIIQFFAQNPQEEEELLRVFARLLGIVQCTVTFNGDRFDIPYLREKYSQYGLPFPLENLESADIYRDVRPLRTFLRLPQMNQQALESFLRTGRGDSQRGGELIHIYRQYCRSPQDALLEPLLKHNLEDVKGLFALTRLYSYLHFLRRAPQKVSGDVLRYDTGGSVLRMVFPLDQDVPVPVLWQDHQARIHLAADQGELMTPMWEGDLLHFFAPYQDYYYLPLEDQAIHKDVAVYMDKAHRQKAGPHNCYVHCQGLFLPQPIQRFSPVFRRSYQDSSLWFLAPENFLQDEDFLRDYADMLIQNLPLL